MLTSWDDFFKVHTYIFLASIAIFLVLIIANYFYRKWLNNLLNSNINPGIKKHFVEIIIAFLMGIISLVLVGFYFIYQSKLLILSYFAFFMIIAIRFSILSSTIYFLPIAISWPIIQTVQGYDALWIGFFYLVFLVYWLGIAFCKIFKWKKEWEYIVIRLLGSVINIYICYLMLGQNQLGWFSVQMLFDFLTFIFFYLIFIGNDKVIDNLEKLNRAIMYNNKQFINASYAHQLIKKKINQLNCNAGLVILFNFSNIDNVYLQIGNYAASKIKANLIQSLSEIYKKYNPIFYVTDQNEYACFFPINDFRINNMQILYKSNYQNKHLKNDPLYEFSELLNTLPSFVKYNDKIVKVKINASIAIYGIHNCDLNLLEARCRINLLNFVGSKNNNVIYVNNPLKNDEENLKNVNYEALAELIPYKSLYFNFIKTKNDKAFQYWFEPEISCVSKLYFNNKQILAQAKKLNLYEEVSRFLAYESIKKFLEHKPKNTYKLIIDYPINYLSSLNFVGSFFYRKILNSSLNPKQIILRLNLNDNFISTKELLDNVEYIKKIGCSILLINANDSKLDLIKKIQPDFLKTDYQNNESILSKTFVQWMKLVNIKNLD